MWLDGDRRACAGGHCCAHRGRAGEPVRGNTQRRTLLPPPPAAAVRRPATPADARARVCVRPAPRRHRTALEKVNITEFAGSAKAAGKPLTVLVNDPHRVTDTPSFIKALFGLIDEAIEPANQPTYRMVVSQGSHKANAEEIAAFELKLLGEEFRPRFSEIHWHTAYDEGLVQVGSNSFMPWMGEKGFYLACGSLEPHYFAGVTGAHKTLTVGVWSYDSLQQNHSGSMHPGSGGMQLEGNPVYEGFAAAIEELKADGCQMLVVNQLICNGATCGVFSGDPITALHDGIAMVTKCFAATISGGPVDLIIAEMDPPLNRDLYQADKGIKNTEFVVKDGGVILLEAACEHGVGITHFVELMKKAATYEEAMALVNEKGYSLGDHKAVKLRNLTANRGVRIGVISPALAADAAELEPILQMKIFSTREEGATWANETLGSDYRSLLVHDAGNLTLVLDDSDSKM
jgi:nickel-dependent lactate racemase